MSSFVVHHKIRHDKNVADYCIISESNKKIPQAVKYFNFQFQIPFPQKQNTSDPILLKPKWGLKCIVPKIGNFDLEHPVFLSC